MRGGIPFLRTALFGAALACAHRALGADSPLQEVQDRIAAHWTAKKPVVEGWKLVGWIDGLVQGGTLSLDDRARVVRSEQDFERRLIEAELEAAPAKGFQPSLEKLRRIDPEFWAGPLAAAVKMVPMDAAVLALGLERADKASPKDRPDRFRWLVDRHFEALKGRKDPDRWLALGDFIAANEARYGVDRGYWEWAVPPSASAWIRAGARDRLSAFLEADAKRFQAEREKTLQKGTASAPPGLVTELQYRPPLGEIGRDEGLGYRVKPAGGTGYAYPKEPPAGKDGIEEFWKSARMQKVISRSESEERYTFVDMWQRQVWDEEASCWADIPWKAWREYYAANLSAWFKGRAQRRAELESWQQQFDAIGAETEELRKGMQAAWQSPENLEGLIGELREAEKNRSLLNAPCWIANYWADLAVWDAEIGKMARDYLAKGGKQADLDALEAAVPAPAVPRKPTPGELRKAEIQDAAGKKRLADLKQQQEALTASIRDLKEKIEVNERRIAWLDQMLKRVNTETTGPKKEQEEKRRENAKLKEDIRKAEAQLKVLEKELKK